MKAFIKDAQRIIVDGFHTPTVVFMSRRAAQAWDVEEFRLRGRCIRLNLVEARQAGICPPPQLALNYALRGLGTEGIHAVQIIQVMEDITHTHVLDIRHPGAMGLSLPDNDYWTVIFATKSCPSDPTVPARKCETSLRRERLNLAQDDGLGMRSAVPTPDRPDTADVRAPKKATDATAPTTAAARHRATVAAYQDLANSSSSDSDEEPGEASQPQ
ncbi:unnamed protein product [Phytophthora fragariaefolia]|uniref:Unnamed protein product n=1 Tax=Phytophthora fragariaefolia TaxID=1490495 RepID=A0A9W6TP31_9STRA|nr:unnamed protein product [Phytophthora fragariaefolia]